MLIDEVAEYESLRQARDLGFAPSASESPALKDTLPWIIDRFDEVHQLIEVFNGLINKNLQAALGAPGEAGNASAIILVSRQLGLVYKHFLDLSLRFMMTKHDKVFDGIFRELAKMHEEVIKEFEIFGPRSLAALTDAVTAAVKGEPRSLQLKMTLTCDSEALMAEIEAAKPAVLRRIRSQQGY